MTKITLKTFTISALALVGLLGGAASAAPCVTFLGLSHCPVGTATLAITQGQLALTANGPTGGVTIATPGASSWSGDTRIRLATGAGDVLKSSSLASGVVTSTSQATAISNGFSLSATFTASAGVPKFSVLLFRNGALQATSNGLTSGSTAATFIGPHVLAGWENLQWPTFIVATGGACTWTYRTIGGADHNVILPDGRTFLADEIRLVEDVAPGGAYPYLTFDALRFEGKINSSRFLTEVMQ